MADRWRFTFFEGIWGGSRPIEEHARLCIAAGAPVVVLGPGNLKKGSLMRWQAEKIIVKVIREAKWADVLACRRATGNPNCPMKNGKKSIMRSEP